MVVKGWKDNGPELLEEHIVEEGVELDVNAGEAGLNAGCLPVDEGVEDGLPLGVFKLEKAGCGMLGDEIECLQDSDAHLLLGQVWELLFELSKGLSIGFGLGVKLVAVAIFATTVLPNAVGKGLEPVGIWCVVFPLV